MDSWVGIETKWEQTGFDAAGQEKLCRSLTKFVVLSETWDETEKGLQNVGTGWTQNSGSNQQTISKRTYTTSWTTLGGENDGERAEACRHKNRA